MGLEFKILIKRDKEGFYITEVPSLKGSHTQAKSLNDLMSRIKEAIELFLGKSKNYPILRTPLLKKGNF